MGVQHKETGVITVTDEQEEEESHVPDDLIYEICVRLPVKSVLRFRRVSKLWSNIITGKTFAKDHTSTRRNIVSPSKIIITHPLSSANCDSHIYSMSRNSSVQLSPPIRFKWPFRDDHQGGCSWFVSSSCNGILCLTCYSSLAATIFVWNPCTGQSTKISLPVPLKKNNTRRSFVGFGYDHVAGDYKIVINTRVHAQQVTQVMTLGTSVWRSITDSTSWGTCISKPVTVGGDVFWISRRDGVTVDGDGRSLFVLKFSTTDETVTTISAPPLPGGGGFEERDGWIMQLGEYIGSLCFFYYQSLFRCTVSAHIWEMRDDKAATWNTLMNVPDMPVTIAGARGLIVLGFNGSGDLIMTSRNGYGLFVYMPAKEKIAILRFDKTDLPPRRRNPNVAIHHSDTEALFLPS